MRNYYLRWGYVFVLLISSQALAFDGRRQGFIFEIGLGGGYVGFDPGGITGTYESHLALMSDLNVGMVGNKGAGLFLSNKLNLFPVSEGTQNTVHLNSLHALVFRYYNREERTTYPIMGIGLATVSTPFASNPRSWIGVGAVVGVGMEFGHDSALELNFMYSRVGYFGSNIDIIGGRAVLLLSAY